MTIAEYLQTPKAIQSLLSSFTAPRATIWVALSAAGSLLTAAIIYWQARLLRVQNQVQALLQFNLAWDSREMHALRAGWAANPSDLAAVEPVLEFLEEFAGLGVRGVFKRELIWDSTVGWHAARYYFYNLENQVLSRLRAKWLDETLFQNLERLWRHYQAVESRKRFEGNKSLEEQMRQTKDKFLADEKERYARRFPESRH
jgi:hypothetical protein